MSTQSILADDVASTLSAFALGNVLLAFDYDGTLAPIAATPARARMRPATHRLLQQVARAYPCVVISGRALADISRRLARVPLWYVFGNHGSEPMGAASTDRTDAWVASLQAALHGMAGVVVEDKRYSVTVHYRGAKDRMDARAAVLKAAEQLADVRIVGGSEAINLLRRDAPDKGAALAYAVRAFACDTAIYIGDDDTDEDAFAALPSDRLLSIRIGATPACSRARFHLRSQKEIDTFMDRLLLLRREGRKGQPRESFEFTP
jgi:trehalose 6-phosphate phosphatase